MLPYRSTLPNMVRELHALKRIWITARNVYSYGWGHDTALLDLSALDFRPL